MNIQEEAPYNMRTRFAGNPCRGIVIGKDDSNNIIQYAWIMGRSANSQNRLYVVEDGIVKTQPFDHSKVEDPRLIIYNVMRSTDKAHVVSNGDQTDTIIDRFRKQDNLDFETFVGALTTRCCEPDAPTFTPRISGYSITNGDFAYLSILKADPAAKEKWVGTIKKHNLKKEDFKKPEMKDSEVTDAFNLHVANLSGFDYKAFPTKSSFFRLSLSHGLGYCMTTYKEGSAQTLDSFEGEPFIVPVRGTLEDSMRVFWESLERDWRVSLVGKLIPPKDVPMIAEPINKMSR